MKQREKGITLIALVITIIVLLILAGVSIAMLTGENGILNQTKNAKEETEKAKQEELAKLEQTEDYINKQTKTLPATDETKPFLPEGAFVTNDDFNTGITIKDKNNNEWVWIEVPKSIYTTASSNIDYLNIEKDMQAYASKYRTNWQDKWISEEQHGFATEEDYNNLKNTMLKSVYENGGFYIGKYEAGTVEPRTSDTQELTIPLIQKGLFPYIYVTCKESQMQANLLATGNRKSSLLFGIQWDLVLKYIEIKGAKTEEELNKDSSSWGNYKDATFELKQGKYTTNAADKNSWITINQTYQKPQGQATLITTGATERNSVLNIYDLAGNMYAWTLEGTTHPVSFCSGRGGDYSNSNPNNNVAIRTNQLPTAKGSGIGIRATLY